MTHQWIATVQQDLPTSSPDNSSIETRLIHSPATSGEGFGSAAVAVHRASTTYFASTRALREQDWRDESRYSYGLHGTPTTLTLAQRIAELEGGAKALLLPSGLAAISLVNLAFLNPGDTVLVPLNAYSPTLAMARSMMGRYGITTQIYDPMAPDTVEWTASIRLIWLEAAGSITLEFPDLYRWVATARKYGVITVLDNTWGAGLAFDAFALGVDMTVHALTKYPSGGAGVLLGSVVSRDESLHWTLKHCYSQLGMGVSPSDAERVLRSLPTLPLRYRQQDQTTRQLADWLQRPERQSELLAVLHPALPHSIGHEHWKTICNNHLDNHNVNQDNQNKYYQGKAAGLISLVFRPEVTLDQLYAFCDALRVFRIGYSWGGPVSLAMPYPWQEIRASVPEGFKGSSGILRLAIGLEAATDLINDLTQAWPSLSNLGTTGTAP